MQLKVTPGLCNNLLGTLDESFLKKCQKFKHGNRLFPLASPMANAVSIKPKFYQWTNHTVGLLAKFRLYSPNPNQITPDRNTCLSLLMLICWFWLFKYQQLQEFTIWTKFDMWKHSNQVPLPAEWEVAVINICVKNKQESGKERNLFFSG